VPGRLRAVPDVEMVGDEVRTGEPGNLAVLKRDEWNLLVELIHSGQLTKIAWTSSTGVDSSRCPWCRREAT